MNTKEHREELRDLKIFLSLLWQSKDDRSITNLRECNLKKYETTCHSELI